MSTLAYRMSTILFHSGVNYQDIVRLNHLLGVCMLPKRMTVLQAMILVKGHTTRIFGLSFDEDANLIFIITSNWNIKLFP
jgi:hypothetical protein